MITPYKSKFSEINEQGYEDFDPDKMNRQIANDLDDQIYDALIEVASNSSSYSKIISKKDIDSFRVWFQTLVDNKDFIKEDLVTFIFKSIQ